MALTERKAGVLMPLFSLPGKYGIGSLGEEARAFARFLKAAGQTYWQVLPTGPTGYGDSPYQSFSTFAGNPYLIDLEQLIGEGLLTREECEACSWGEQENRVDYGLLYQNRYALLEKAFARFRPQRAYEAFRREQAFWLEDYGRFMSDKEGRPQEYYFVLQYLFAVQWRAFRQYVNGLGIRLIGDIPIYVAMDSADVAADRRLFQFDAAGRPAAVAGCPPDAFAEEGQLWGNPLYDWAYHQKTGYAWWIRRLRHCFSLYDVVRVDHFRGFDAYYAIPYGAKDARGGHWEAGPGLALFKAVREALGEVDIIAEDLGYLTDSVVSLVRESGYPGMKLLEFAFDSREEADYRPSTWTRRCVAYTGTHDNQTLAGWFRELTARDRAAAAAYLGTDVRHLGKSDYVYRLIQTVLNSVADTAIIPMQDYLRLGTEGRINRPSTLGGNWTWRFRREDFTELLAMTMKRLTAAGKRL